MTRTSYMLLVFLIFVLLHSNYSAKDWFAFDVHGVLYELYFDGMPVNASQIPYANISDITDVVPLPCGTRVIGLTLSRGSQSVGRFVASDSFGNILTNSSSWRCTDQLWVNWQYTNYDDSCWPTALMPFRPNAYPRASPINSSARWIWSSFANNTDATFYCRFRFDTMLVPSACTSLYIDAFYSMDALYLDGNRVPSFFLQYAWFPHMVDIVAMPNPTTVIAVIVQTMTSRWDTIDNWLLVYDPMAGISSSSPWRCINATDDIESGWMNPGYNASWWPLAVPDPLDWWAFDESPINLTNMNSIGTGSNIDSPAVYCRLDRDPQVGIPDGHLASTKMTDCPSDATISMTSTTSTICEFC